MRILKNKMNKTVRIEYSYICHRGNIRTENQDNFVICADNKVVIRKEDMEKSGHGVCLNSIRCAVFDGMGGMSKGETASLIATDITVEDMDKLDEDEERINTLFKDINKEIEDYRIRNRISDMGTTGVVAIANANELVYGNIGDSRLYYFKKGKLQQCSVDHTMRQPYSGNRLLIQYLGIDSDYELEPQLGRKNVEPGNEILLCSDGLTDCLSDEEIEKILNSSSNVDIQIQELLDMTLKQEAQDNISIIICRWEYEK